MKKRWKEIQMFNKLFKKFLMIIIIISLIFSFNSYTNSSRNLDDQSYVMAIGIDKGQTSDYKISLQLLIYAKLQNLPEFTSPLLFFFLIILPYSTPKAL